MKTMGKFFFDSGSGGNSEVEDDEDNLPYPEALLRTDFLSPDFEAATYLSTLSDRHQTLDDLQSDLRERSQFLSKELLDLVNTKYEKFLSLGEDLKGGEERIESVRVGLLGFKSGVSDIRGKVKDKKDEVEALLREKISIRRDIAFGRNLLELDARLEELERRLKVITLSSNLNGDIEKDISIDDIYDEDVDNDGFTVTDVSGFSPKWIQRLASEFCYIESLIENIGTDHPFVISQNFRLMQIKKKILIALSKALNLSKVTSKEEKYELVELLGIYSKLGAANEAVKVLKEFKWKE